MNLLENGAALSRIGAGEIEHLTRAATEATFYDAPLSDEQVAANRRVAAISASTCEVAAQSANQHFVAAWLHERFAGYVIATRHEQQGCELDWLMVHPTFHGSPVAAALMGAGMEWLGASSPVWLTVIQHNQRAIRFYEKFGFAVDPTARTTHIVPHHIMRRPGG